MSGAYIGIAAHQQQTERADEPDDRQHEREPVALAKPTAPPSSRTLSSLSSVTDLHDRWSARSLLERGRVQPVLDGSR